MTLLSPLALALSALAAPIILMYILKLRRRPMVVSSTFLWRKALDDVQANAPWRRLRVTTLLILQILVLLALVLVQAQPAFSRTERLTADLILIVDVSYGMQAHDVGPTRFAVAQGDAHSLANTVGSGEVVSVIGMGAQPSLEIGDSSDPGAVSRAIDSLRDGLSAPNFPEALSLAGSLARSGQATRAVVLTSRQSGISSLPLQVPFPVEIMRIGGRLRDLGISDFAASSARGKTKALARVENFGIATARSDLDLFVDGQLADVRPLQIAPGQQSVQRWNDLPGNARVLHVRLTQPDDVTTDKQAWAVVRAASQTRVLLVSRGDYFLQTALTLDPAIQLSVVEPSVFKPALVRHYDLVVFDGILPATLPKGPGYPVPVLLISPPAGTVRTAGTRLTFGRLVAGATVSPAPSPPGLPGVAAITQYVDVSDVHVAAERGASLPGWMEPVFLSGTSPLVAAGETNGRRVAATTFNLQESDWPLRISFPILIKNLVDYLIPGVGVGATNVPIGQMVPLLPEPGVKEVEITRPGGPVVRVRLPFAPFTNTAVPGVYMVRELGRTQIVDFAVNFMPSRPTPAAGPARVTLGASKRGGSRSVGVPADLDWVVVLACLGLLTTEWWLAFRR